MVAIRTIGCAAPNHRSVAAGDGAEGMGMDQLLDVITEETPAGVVIRVVGELDASTIAELRRACEAVERDRRTEITVDLRDLTFSDSSGLRALLRLQGYADAAGARLSLIPGPAPLMRLLEVAGALETFAFLDEARL